ncbi:MAG: transcriptional regulator [Chromatiales bacterium 21-64-14]|nr:MAG: transcriptional regulator [Chromatiales bacterium 21-64-14]
MLWALAGGEALPASELAYRAGITCQTASYHLARLVEARLLTVEPCLRYRYYRLASPEVAHLLEDLMALSGPPPLRDRADRAVVDRLRLARSCYDHLAGGLGVALTDALDCQGWIELSERDYRVTPCGDAGFSGLGIEIPVLRRQPRLFARRCIDWSERRPHIGGAVGAALMERLQALGWIRRERATRVIRVTPRGRRGLWDTFGFGTK